MSQVVISWKNGVLLYNAVVIPGEDGALLVKIVLYFIKIALFSMYGASLWRWSLKTHIIFEDWVKEKDISLRLSILWEEELIEVRRDDI